MHFSSKFGGLRGSFWLQVGSLEGHSGSKLGVLGVILAPSRGSWGSGDLGVMLAPKLGILGQLDHFNRQLGHSMAPKVGHKVPFRMGGSGASGMGNWQLASVNKKIANSKVASNTKK